METLNLGEVAKDQKKVVKRKKKEEKAKETLKRKKSTMAKLLFRLSLIVAIAVGIYVLWDNYQLQKPISVNVALQPLVVKRVKVVQVITPATFIYPKEIETTAEKKICDKWGPYECKTAIAVAKHEGLNHEVYEFNTNTNGTIDVGYFRINSVHFDKEGCSLAEVITEEGNINCAYQLWKEQGWKIWVAYINGSYLSSL